MHAGFYVTSYEFTISGLTTWWIIIVWKYYYCFVVHSEAWCKKT